MAFLYFKRVNTGTLADGDAKELTWTPERDVIIKRLFMTARGGTSLENVQVLIKVADVPYTRPDIPGIILGYDSETAWIWDKPVTKGVEVYFKVTNNSGFSDIFDIIMECYEA